MTEQPTTTTEQSREEELKAAVAYHLQEHGLACGCPIDWLSGAIVRTVLDLYDKR